jgi:hypothetical protein
MLTSCVGTNVINSQLITKTNTEKIEITNTISNANGNNLLNPTKDVLLPTNTPQVIPTIDINVPDIADVYPESIDDWGIRFQTVYSPNKMWRVNWTHNYSTIVQSTSKNTQWELKYWYYPIYWTPDNQYVYLNRPGLRHPFPGCHVSVPLETEVSKVELLTGIRQTIFTKTDSVTEAKLSPNGKMMAYIKIDNKYQPVLLGIREFQNNSDTFIALDKKYDQQGHILWSNDNNNLIIIMANVDREEDCDKLKFSMMLYDVKNNMTRYLYRDLNVAYRAIKWINNDSILLERLMYDPEKYWTVQYWELNINSSEISQVIPITTK